MIIKSNPFLRNDYYPDQNDIDDLNTRINEVQSDVDLLAISVNEKAEAVNGRLNILQNDYNESFETEALKANTADLNVLNVNVQATIKDLNADNTYIENLIVNKPVQDLSLRTPHLENTTSLNGNFYAPNILGGVFDNIQIENMQNFKAVNIEADGVTANIADFNEVKANTVKTNTIEFNVLNAINIQADEVTANTATLNLLSAANIHVDEVIAELVDLNVLDSWNIYVKQEVKANTVKANIANLKTLNAMSIEAGEVKANIADLKGLNAMNIQVDKVTANAVKANIINLNVLNAVNIEADEVKANKLIGDFSAEPISSSAVVGYDENGQLIPIRASYDVSLPESSDYLKTDAQGVARKGTSESEVVQSTNLIQAGAVQNMYDAVNADFNNVQNTLSDIESNINNFQNILLSDIYIPEYGSFSSFSPVNYTAAKNVVLYGDAQGGTAIPNGGGMIKFDSSTNIVTFGFSGACKGIKNALSMFQECLGLNQNILIPKSVVNAKDMFRTCLSLNKNILIPNSVVDANSMFHECVKLNQNILIPNSVKNATNMFAACYNLNQIILIPNSVVNAKDMFYQCDNLNKDIYIYSQVLSNMTGMFSSTKVNLHNVHIPSSVPKDTSNYIYNSLVNGETGVTFAPENIINDLPVNPVDWPPIN